MSGEIDRIVAEQRAFFRSGATLPNEWRRERLAAFAAAIHRHEATILEAVRRDLNKGPFEAWTAEIGLVLDEIKLARKRLPRWARRRRVKTPIVSLPGSSAIVPRPRGTSAIIGPWNYPFQLVMAPIVAAVAAGNTAVVKPSEFAPNTAEAVAAVVADAFDRRHVAVVLGDAAVAVALTAADVQHIFFTGSTAVGRAVMHAAADRLVPVTLELGGKSPAIVTDSSRVAVAARRVAWGRYMNAGQTCIAPDYAVVHEGIVEPFVAALNDAVREFYGASPAESEDYGRIIDGRHLQRLRELVRRQSELGAPRFGGDAVDEVRYLSPTCFAPVRWDDPVMEEEIFGPILPVIPYRDFDEVIERIAARPSPLAAYLFTERREDVRAWEGRLPFGGGAVNDTIVHLVNPELPFGGCGPSGIGSYHGEAGFREFSNTTSIVRRSSRFDVRLRYPPYGDALKYIKRVIG